MGAAIFFCALVLVLPVAALLRSFGALSVVDGWHARLDVLELETGRVARQVAEAARKA